jgi:dATP pyrophosphohydrolase
VPAYKTPISVLVVIHTPDGQVLLIERAAHPGFWQSVTGSCEGDESLQETARREVEEETGISCPANQFKDWQQSSTFEIFAQWRHRYAPGVTHNVEHVFSLCLPAPCPVRLAPNEHRAWQWLPAAEAAERCFSASNRDAILALPLHSVR